MKRQHMVAYTIRSNDNWNYQRMNIESWKIEWLIY
jgi:hypothetical protein